jgi:hypothetical protein
VESGEADVVVIGSLNAYLQAMSGDKHLLLQMHELLIYLKQRGIVTILILARLGVLAFVRSEIGDGTSVELHFPKAPPDGCVSRSHDGATPDCVAGRPGACRGPASSRRGICG